MSTRVAGLVFAAVGVLVLVLSVNARPAVPQGWTVVQGTVVDFVTRESSDGGSTRAAVVEYGDGGNLYRIVSTMSFGLGLGEKLGDPVDVAFNPARPGQARITGGSAAWGWLIGVAVGALFALVGLALFASGRRRRSGAEEPATARDSTVSGPVETRHIGGMGYVFGRDRTRIWLDVLIAPAMALMFLGFAWVTFMAGGLLVFMSLAAMAAALLLIGTSVHDMRIGLFAPAAEVGAAGIWLRGAGHFAWSELAEVRHERFAGPAGDQGLTMYGRLALVPRDAEREAKGATRLGTRMVNAYYRTFLPLAGRRPITMASVGLMAYEVADFEGLLREVGRFFPVTQVSDAPSAARAG